MQAISPLFSLLLAPVAATPNNRTAVLEQVAARLRKHREALHNSERRQKWSTEFRIDLEKHADSARQLIIWADRALETSKLSDGERAFVEDIRKGADQVAKDIDLRVVEIEKHLAEERARAYQETERMFGRGASKADEHTPPIPAAPGAPEIDAGPMLDLGNLNLGVSMVAAALAEMRTRVSAISDLVATGNLDAIETELAALELDLEHGMSAGNATPAERTEAKHIRSAIEATRRTVAARRQQAERASRMAGKLDSVEQVQQQKPAPRRIA